MRPGFQADADLNNIIVLALVRRFPGIDFRSALAAGLPGLADPDVLARVAADGRILVSHDQTTMPWHFARFIQTTTSPGVIIAPQSRPLNEVIDDLALIWLASDAADWVNRLAYLPI